MRVLGLMSGTSMDGVDAAVLETDGEAILGFGPTGFRAYSGEERAVLRAGLGLWPEAEGLGAIEALVRGTHAALVAGFDAVDLVGFHGQTLAHDPGGRGTHQIGRGDLLAKEIGRRVVWDFRAADVASGGEGAPLVPFFHFACARWIGAAAPVAFLNLGGVGNVTWVDPRVATPETPGALVAFDTGPGNALIDDHMFRTMNQRFDKEGEFAAKGRVNQAWVSAALKLPFFGLKPPKSLDRNDFASLKVADMTPADGAATLTAFTAAAIARIVPLLPKWPNSWIVCGGGARNRTLMRMLRERLEPATVDAAEVLGWSSDALEAQAFGFLAARGLKGLPLSYPATTGVPMPMTGGVIARP